MGWGCTAEEIFGDVGGETVDMVGFGIDDVQILKHLVNYNYTIYYIPLIQIRNTPNHHTVSTILEFSILNLHPTHNKTGIVLYYNLKLGSVFLGGSFLIYD
jgi:uncharacterized membrane protein